ncbi:MAG: DUF4422 domain-containing protein [Eubacterium sp.]|nr:DUF4422 domain-containing protein [Eubacterium sp.]
MFVMTHKKFKEYKGEGYEVMHVGRALSTDLGYSGDNTGDNISGKNKNYCELTGLYYIWKNIDCDIVGTCHYRRYFLGEDKHILTKPEIEKYLEDYDIIVPVAGTIEMGDNLWEHYKLYHKPKDMEITRDILLEKHPEYEKVFNLAMDKRYINYANMMICKKEIYDEYCAWMYDILFEVEKRVDISDYDDYQKRIFGFISERLFRVWLSMHKYRVKEAEVDIIEDVEEYEKNLLPDEVSFGERNKRIWIYCREGINDAPFIKKLCVLSQCFVFGALGYEIMLMTDENKPHFKLDENGIKEEDYGRYLTKKYGGIWSDAYNFADAGCAAGDFDFIEEAVKNAPCSKMNSDLRAVYDEEDYKKKVKEYPVFKLEEDHSVVLRVFDGRETVLGYLNRQVEELIKNG